MSTAEDTGPRERGSVVAWSNFETFGFARRDSDPQGRQIFLHIKHVAGECRLAPGTRIEFGVIDTPKGLRAVCVSPLQ